MTCQKRPPIWPAKIIPSFCRAGLALLLGLFPAVIGRAQDSDSPKISPGGPVQETTPMAKSELPFTKKDSLEKLEKHLPKILKFELSDRKISVEGANYQKLQPVISAIQQEMGYGGSSSGSSGTGFTYRFDNQNMKSRIRSSTKRVKGEKQQTYELMFTETKKLQRTLKFRQADGGWNLSIDGGSEPYLLRLCQSKTGQVLVQEVHGTKAFAAGAADFESLLMLHPRFANQRLLPMLRRFGLAEFPTPYDQEVQELIAASLVSMTGAEKEKFQELSQGLSSNDFEERKKAAERLDQNWKGNAPLFLKALNESSLSPEIRFRVQQILEKNKKSKLVEKLAYARRSGLAKDPDYLYWLGQQDSFSEQAARIQSRLVQLVQSELDKQGKSLDEYMQSRKPALANQEGENAWVTDPTKEKGVLDKGKKTLAQFIQFTRDKDRLILDQTYFAKLFGGKTISQLANEVDKVRQANHLPASWFKSGGDYRITEVDYPQVHFERLAEKFSASRQNQYAYIDHFHSSRSQSAQKNRQSENDNVRMSLIDARKARRTKDGIKFQFKLEELKAPGRSLLVQLTKEDRMTLKITNESANVVVQIVSTPERVLVQDLRGDQIQVAEAKDLAELFEKHENFLKQKLFPLLQHFGFSLSPELRGESKVTIESP